jgi:heme-degrading monooxygenase HmoA
VIVRAWHGETPATKADGYAAYLDRTGVPDYRATPGNRGVEVLRRVEGDRAHFLVITYWDSWAAVAAFAGADVTRARYYPEDAAYLVALEPTVTHYELVAAHPPRDGASRMS